MNKGTLNFEELCVMLVFCFALLMLVSKVRVKIPVLVSRREHPKLDALDEILELAAIMCVFGSHSRILR